MVLPNQHGKDEDEEYEAVMKERNMEEALAAKAIEA